MWNGWINKVLLHRTENCVQHPVINLIGNEYFKKERVYVCVCVCITEHSSVQQKLTHCKSIVI